MGLQTSLGLVLGELAIVGLVAEALRGLLGFIHIDLCAISWLLAPANGLSLTQPNSLSMSL